MKKYLKFSIAISILFKAPLFVYSQKEKANIITTEITTLQPYKGIQANGDKKIIFTQGETATFKMECAKENAAFFSVWKS